jgi:heme/copper-type cytochrome/quinol oxidase subunit 2
MNHSTAPKEQSPSMLPVTVPNHLSSNADPAIPRQKRTAVWYALTAIAFVALVVVGATVALAVLRKTSKERNAATKPSTKRQQEISAMIRSIADPAKLAMASSPQSQAHAWLTLDDTWADESIAITLAMVTQRYALAVVYFATRGPSSWVAPNGWLQGHECQTAATTATTAWVGITCNRLEQVHTLVLGTCPV